MRRAEPSRPTASTVQLATRTGGRPSGRGPPCRAVGSAGPVPQRRSAARLAGWQGRTATASEAGPGRRSAARAPRQPPYTTSCPRRRCTRESLFTACLMMPLPAQGRSPRVKSVTVLPAHVYVKTVRSERAAAAARFFSPGNAAGSPTFTRSAASGPQWSRHAAPEGRRADFCRRLTKTTKASGRHRQEEPAVLANHERGNEQTAAHGSVTTRRWSVPSLEKRKAHAGGPS